MAAKGSAEATEATAGAPEPPPGGLDAPAPRAKPEKEAFPGESQLTDDERNRWLILHFAVPRTIATCDLAEDRSTEAEINDVLSSMAWGTLNPETAEWQAEVDVPEMTAPDDSRISYAEYLQRQFPTDQGVDPDVREENERNAAEKRASFTNNGEPGAKFRATFDQMVKCLAYSNKALVKAFDVKKVILNENEEPEDPSKDEATNIVRFGRHQILPSFWTLLTSLVRARRRFSIVFRTFGEELPSVQRELRLFCQGQHPCYSGQNKTQKPPPMDGQKASRDMRLADEQLGRFLRMSGRLEFLKRPMEADGAARAAEDPGGAAAGAGAEAAVSAVASAAPQSSTDSANPLAFRPTVYEFAPFHAAYAGLMHHILGEHGSNACGIVDDRDFWVAKGRVASAGKPLLVDYGGSFGEAKVQHVFFDGHIQANDAHCVDVRDVVTGDPVPFEEANDIFIHRVNFYQAVIDQDYFVKALETCELNMSQKIVEKRRMKALEAERAAKEGPEALRKLPPKDYLYKTVIPALLPAMEACQRDRPADPIAFIAFYMLRHSQGYSKSLEA